MLKGGRVVGIGSLEELEGSEHPYVQQFFARRPDDDDSSESAYAKALTGIE
jgi:ABC-type transporter Mla maintaining outer membrane lipid asymmetry ATPase subunit MlaF